MMNATKLPTQKSDLLWRNSRLGGITYLFGWLLLIAAAISGGSIAGGGTVTVRKQGVAAIPLSQDKSTARAAYAQLPLIFETNQGQTDPRVKFLCRGIGYGLFLTGSDTVLTLSRAQPKEKPPMAKGVNGVIASRESGDVLRFKLVGANAQSQVEGVEPLPGTSNYFISNDPKKWRTNISQFARVKSDQVYPGINLVYYGRQRRLEYDFQVAPGANPAAIRLVIDGAQKASLNARCDLVLQTPGGDVTERAPTFSKSRMEPICLVSSLLGA